jgi:hypothetical protein
LIRRLSHCLRNAPVLRGSTIIDNAHSQADVTLSPAVDLAKSFPIISFRTGGNICGGNDFAKAYITSTTNLNLALQANGDAGNAATVEWQVVTYTGANVQSGDVTIAAGSTSNTATVSSVDLTKSWLIYTYNLGDGNTADIGQHLVRGLITNATTLTFDRAHEGSTTTAVQITYYLLQFTDGTTVQSGNKSFGTGDTTLAQGIMSVDTTRSIDAGGYFCRGGSSSYSTNDNLGVGWFTLDLTSGTNLQITRGLTGTSTANVGWFVVQFPSTFSHRKTITIDHTKLGASCSSSLPSFPVLIKLPSDYDLRTVANGGHVQNANGYDIVFRASDGTTALDHEMEKYVATTGELWAWVRIPSLSNSVDTIIYIYYGSSSINSPTQNPTAVWDSNYKGVWHLKETPADGVAGHVDSTGNSHTGAPQGFSDGGGGTTDSTGIAAGADYFAQDTTGTTNRIEVPDDAVLRPNGDFTIEGWVYLDAPAAADHMIYKQDTDWFSYQIWFGGSVAHFQWSDTGRNAPIAVGTTTLSASTWYHIAGVKSGTTLQVYTNGVAGTAATGATGSTYTGTDPLMFGAVYSGGGGMGGRVDEVRFSSIARGQCWLQTEYNNENSPSTFYTVGSEEATKMLVILTADGTFNNGDDNAKKTFFESLGYTVTAIADDADQATYDSAAASNNVMWMSTTIDASAATTAGQRARSLNIRIVSDDISTWGALTYYSGSNSSSSGATTIYVNNNSHYITQPFSTGNLTVFDSSTNRSGWGVALPAGATLLAELSSGGADTLFAVDTGGALYNSNTVANRRVFFGVTDNTGFSSRTANLETLIQRALEWTGSLTGSPDVTLANHDAGQETDALSTQHSVTGAELFAFQLTNNTGSAMTVDQIVFPLSAVTGISQGDFGNLQIYVDANNNGTTDPGETTVVGGTGVVNAGVTSITFTTDSTISAGATVNYILKGNVSNLVNNDTVTISLGAGNIALSSGTVGGTSPTNVTETSEADPYYYRKQITIDYTRVGASCGANLTSFPVLVKIASDDDLRTVGNAGHVQNANGYDIVFRASNGTTALDHEVDKYTPTSGELWAWVRIPTLSYSADTIIYLYYRNTAINTSQENKSGVWDNSFKGVWDLHNSFADSTSNGNTGTNNGSTDVVGEIADGRLFAAASKQYVDVPTSTSLNITGNTITVEAWINATSWADNWNLGSVVNKEDWGVGTNGYAPSGWEKPSYHRNWGGII